MKKENKTTFGPQAYEAKVDAYVSAAIEVVRSIKELDDGNKDLGDVAVDVAITGMKVAAARAATTTTVYAIGSATATAIGLTLGSTAAGGAIIAATTMAAPLVAVVAIGGLIGKIFDW